MRTPGAPCVSGSVAKVPLALSAGIGHSRVSKTAAPTRCIAEPLMKTIPGNDKTPMTLDLSKSPFSQYAPEPWRHAHSLIEEASTPPSSWYTSPQVAELEKQAVFNRNWLCVGHIGQAPKPGDYFTGEISDMKYVVTRGKDGILRAFHNVCRHKAAPVAEGSGSNCDMFSCLYHGWQFDTEGRFRGATKTKGIKNFKAADYGLVPIRLDTWGHLVFLMGDTTSEAPGVSEWLGEGGRLMEEHCMKAPDLVHVRRIDYHLDCNWKVFNDNYLDTCYHCPFAHPGLCEALDMEAYHSVCYEHNSFQFSPLAPEEARPEGTEWDFVTANRIEGDGRGPAYTFVYPNLMVNRYSMWMGTMMVLPLDANNCKIVMDYWVHTSKVDDTEFIDQVVKGEDVVQREDMYVAKLVQSGLNSPAYDVGRYVPMVEEPVFHFHRQLNADFFS